MKKALILAAGTGKRLGILTRDIPKCLLKIDSERCLIDFSLEALVENGIKEITFITGFREDKLKKHVLEKWAGKSKFDFIYNEKYEEYNNIYSAYLARDLWDDETVLLNSDIIFDQRILSDFVSKLTSSALEKKSYLVIDNSKKLISEDMKVEVNTKGEIKKISKKLNNETSYGEYIGITYLRDSERIKFLQSLEKNVENKKLDIYYEDALADILINSSVFPCSTNGLLWTEVDTEEDYKAAKNIASLIRSPLVV